MENLNLFIRSIFIDNMIFAYFLGMCSFVAVSKNVKTSLGLGIAVLFVLIVSLRIEAGSSFMVRSGIRIDRPQFLGLDNVYRSHSSFGADNRDGGREVRSVVV